MLTKALVCFAVLLAFSACDPLAPSPNSAKEAGQAQISRTGDGDQTQAGKGEGTPSPAAQVSGQSNSAASPSARAGSLPLKATLSSECGRRGDKMVVEIATRKMAQMAIAVSYSDQNPHGNYVVGNADDDGRYRFEWVIPPTAPLGKAQVLIAAGDYSPGPEPYSGSSTGESNSARIPFRVAVTC